MSNRIQTRLAASVAGAAGALLAVAGVARADVVASVNFDDGEAYGWSANGVPTVLDFGGNPGGMLYLPYDMYWQVGLYARDPESGVLGDLTRFGGLRVSFDLQMIAAFNSFGEPLDMESFPIAVELVSYTDDPNFPIVSVYTVGPSMPSVGDGWTRYTFEIPAAEGDALPAGWGGTGDEDPNTGDLRLPAGMTYASVLSRVDEVRVTTMVPGFMYGGNWYEAGWDNLLVESLGSSCGADFNGDGFVDFFDLDAFLAEFELGC